MITERELFHRGTFSQETFASEMRPMNELVSSENLEGQRCFEATLEVQVDTATLRSLHNRQQTCPSIASTYVNDRKKSFREMRFL